MRKTESNIEPQDIEVDKIQKGSAKLYCTWDLEEIEREGEIVYKYYSGYIWWALPRPEYLNCGKITEAGEAYIEENKTEILGFLQATIQ